MRDEVINFLIGIASSLTASWIFLNLQGRKKWVPAPPKLLEPEEVPESPRNEDEARRRNRDKFESRTLQVVYYFHSFLMIYLAFLMPPMLKASFRNVPLYLSDARFIGNFLPTIEIGSSYLQFGFIFITFLIYVPALLFVDALTYPIARALNNYVLIDIHAWRRIQIVLFSIIALVIAVLSIWLFYNVTLIDTLQVFLFFVGITIALAGSPYRRA